MATLSLHGGGKGYAGRLLFADLHLHLQPGVRTGLVGPNGSGKTTLLRILAGVEEPDAGTVTVTAGSTVGHLHQDTALHPDQSLLDAALGAFAPLWAIEREMRSLEAEMARGPADAACLRRYGRLQEGFQRGGGYEAEAEARRTLAGLGFGGERLGVACRHLSGGERRRLGLAIVLLKRPTFLLLDEPTNHLDLPAITWLEGHLARAAAGALVVSHDRHFLDAVTERTLQMGPRPKTYRGNYTAYLQQRSAAEAGGMEDYRRAQAELPGLRAFIAACRTGHVPVPKNRLRRLAQLEAVPVPDVAVRTMRLAPRTASAGSTGAVALTCVGLRKAFGGRELLGAQGFGARVVRGDRVGLIGPNGSGKSTLLRILRGELSADYGRVAWAEGSRVGWLSQSLRSLDPRLTLVEQLTAVPGVGTRRAREVLAQYLFEEDAMSVRTGDCSGGELCRLALARLLVQPWDALLLDEPTNHLDMEARRALEDGLTGFGGTILVASHDRFFLDRVCWRLWVFGEDGVSDFDGNYSAYTGRDAGAARSPAELATAIRDAEARSAQLRARLSSAGAFADGRGRRLTRLWRATQEELARLQAEWRQATDGPTA